MIQLYHIVATLLDNMVETSEKAQNKQEWDKLVTYVDMLSKRVEGQEKEKMTENLPLENAPKEKARGWFD